MHVRGPQAALLATLIAVAPALAIPALASSAGPATTVASNAVATAPKVVIVVGAVQGTTTSYRAKGDQIYAEAIKYTPNVTRIYSPDATWAKVKAAAQGASVFIYLGHGYGYPSPYRAVLSPSVQDGMGINGTGGIDDSDLKYYGETSIANDIRFAKNAVVILSGLCYAAGSSESGDPAPSIPVAKERIDNFASGWIKAGARVVISDTWVSSNIRTNVCRHQPIRATSVRSRSASGSMTSICSSNSAAAHSRESFWPGNCRCSDWSRSRFPRITATNHKPSLNSITTTSSESSTSAFSAIKTGGCCIWSICPAGRCSTSVEWLLLRSDHPTPVRRCSTR